MSEFVGRTGSNRLYSYPESRRDTTLPFARNFAAGPPGITAVATGDGVTGGTQIPWALIESGAPAGVNVPITPRTTGIIRITGVVAVKNASGAPVNVLVQVQLDGVRSPFPFREEVTVINHAADAQGIGGAAAIPIVAELPVALMIGVTRNIEIVVTAQSSPAISLIVDSSSIDVQEVPVATG